MTTSSRPIRRLYDPLDTANLDYRSEIGWPGEYPFTRGVQPTGYHGRQWTMRMFAGFGSAEETNARFKYLLEHGRPASPSPLTCPLSTDSTPTLPRPPGEFGKCGVCVSSLGGHGDPAGRSAPGRDHDLHDHQLAAAIIWAMYIAAAEKRGVPRAQLAGTIQNDILKEYIAQKEFIGRGRFHDAQLSEHVPHGCGHRNVAPAHDGLHPAGTKIPPTRNAQGVPASGAGTV